MSEKGEERAKDLRGAAEADEKEAVKDEAKDDEKQKGNGNGKGKGKGKGKETPSAGGSGKKVRQSVTAKTTKFADLHGYLKKKSRHDRWQKRWFEANDHYLTYYKSPQSEKLLACIDLYQTGSIKLATEDDQAPGDESYSEFSLELGDRFYIIKAETRGDAKRWVEGLNERKKPKASPSITVSPNNPRQEGR